MKKLSSDVLYYRSLAILIFGPFFMCFFINFSFYKTTPWGMMLFMYGFVLLIFIRGWWNVFKFKQILFDEKTLLIKSYFSASKMEIALDDVKSINKVNYLFYRNMTAYYKITFIYNHSLRTALFYKPMGLFSVDDLETYVGLKKKDVSNA
jgi:hypothetical protein